jgi:ATP/maltotriose-dependent transcriptional regulator MalT
MASTAERLDTGWAAVDDGRFEEGRAFFEEAIAALPEAEAYDGLACALRGLGEVDATLAAREMAHRLYAAEGRNAPAAKVAALIGADLQALRGNGTVARAWLERAERLLEGHEDGCEAGWVGLRAREVFGYEGERDRAAGDRAVELGRRHGDRDLELMGRAVRGLCAVNLGDIAEGMRDLDEVSLAAVAGELRSVTERGRAWCFLIFACERVRDIERAAQWCDTVRRLAERTMHPQLFAYCRTHYAGVLTARGEYAGAEEELRGAALLFAAGAPGLAFDADLMLAELRRRQGRFEEAVQLASLHGWHRTAQLILAELAWDRGDVVDARDALDRHSRRADAGEVLDASALYLAARVGAAEGDADACTGAAAALREVADRGGTLPLRAAARAAGGLAGPSPRAALEDAADLWMQAGMPYEAARAETALAAITGDSAARERAARRLAALGCTADVTALDAPLARGGGRAGYGELSRRELQVLRLVADGLSDREIADRLVLSPHTVHRHVANIRIKLRQPSRAAAAAKAARDGII